MGSKSRWKHKSRIELAAATVVGDKAPESAVTAVASTEAGLPEKTPANKLMHAPPKFTPIPYT